jgi:hypothetical protein
MSRLLGHIERAAALTDQAAPFNAVAAMTLDGPVEETAVRQALERIVERYPQVSMTPVEGRFLPCGVAAAELMTAEGGRPAVDHAIDALLNDRPADRGAHPLRARIIRSPGDHTVVLAAPHWMIDATALARLAFETIGDEPQSPPAPSNEPIESRFPAAFRGARMKLAGYIARQLAEEVGVRLNRLGARRVPTPAWAPVRHVLRSLDADVAARLAAACRRRECTLTGFLAAATGRVFAKTLLGRRGATVRVMSFRDLRRRVVPAAPEGEIAACFSMSRLTLQVGGKSDWPAARTFSRAIAESGRRGDPFLANLAAPAMIRRLVSHRMRVGDVAVNLPVFGRPSEAVAERLKQFEGYVSVMPFAPPISFVAAPARSGLTLGFTYLESEFDAVRAGAIADEVMGRLEAAG